MPQKSIKSSSVSTQPLRPALTPEARENQMIMLSMDLAEKQLREGTASSQVIVHFLKLGSEKEKLEREMMSEQINLLTTKIENMKASERNSQLYEDALAAFKDYRPSDDGGKNDIF